MDFEDKMNELPDEALEHVAGGREDIEQECPKCGYGRMYSTFEPTHNRKHPWAVTFKCYRCDYEALEYR